MLRPFSWATLVWVALASPCAQSQRVHAFDVKDDIAMTRFASEPLDMSPDHRYFAVVTSKGLLSIDRIESQLWIFRIRNVAAAFENPTSKMSKPRLIASVISYPHREQTTPYASLIKDLRWSADSQTLYFRRENAQGFSRLCAVDMHTDRLQILSAPAEDVNLFDISGDTVLYTWSRHRAARSEMGERINADAVVATGRPIFEVLFPDALIQGAPETWSLTVLRRKNRHWMARRIPGFELLDRPLLSSLIPFKLSPDGQIAITLLPATHIPSTWEKYEPAARMGYLHFRGRESDVLDPRNGNRPEEYVRLDLRTGKHTVLIGAPDGRSLGYMEPRRVIWSHDGKRVLVTNTFFPITGDISSDSTATRPCAVASLDLPAGESHCLFFAQASEIPNALGSVDFGRNGGEVTVDWRAASGHQERRTYSLHGDQWQLTVDIPESSGTPQDNEANGRDLSSTDDVQIFVRQTLNDPPTLWARDTRSGESRQLWDPNPQFKSVRFAEAIPYCWRDDAGTDWDGQLVKPLNYVLGKRYPLVIQLYSINRGQFITGGPYPTAFAARELASVGFFVLLVQKKPDTLTEQDVIVHLRAYRSAVNRLVAAGLVDRKRVGVIGFSWTCWYVADVLVRDPGLFAVATIADGLDNSYMQYHFAADVQPIQRQMEHIRGSGPFGEGLKRWLRESPGFHLDQVRVPVRIEAINPASVLQEWELYSSLRMQNKPVDLIYFPSGTHIHQKPLERLESQQGDVDWFRFWLQNYEDPAPSKRKQYARWRGLRREIIGH